MLQNLSRNTSMMTWICTRYVFEQDLIHFIWKQFNETKIKKQLVWAYSGIYKQHASRLHTCTPSGRRLCTREGAASGTIWEHGQWSATCTHTKVFLPSVESWNCCQLFGWNDTEELSQILSEINWRHAAIFCCKMCCCPLLTTPPWWIVGGYNEREEAATPPTS